MQSDQQNPTSDSRLQFQNLCMQKPNSNNDNFLPEKRKQIHHGLIRTHQITDNRSLESEFSEAELQFWNWKRTTQEPNPIIEKAQLRES